jgi:DNA-binding CsgD family transcriptional regulator
MIGELSPTEQKILEQIADENTNEEIANNLNISLKLVNLCCVSLFEKLGVKSFEGLIKQAVKHKLISI